ncbi:MAG: formyltransferase family protein [Deltaproteobacteria bacterium]|nr:formyltransferase family protein [Deltaproteobacteria bacterium]
MLESTIKNLVVVVFSCGGLGVEVANSLNELDTVRSVSLITAPWPARRLSRFGLIRHVYRYGGLPGIFKGIINRLERLLRLTKDKRVFEKEMSLKAGISRYDFDDFHSPECLKLISQIKPDVGVVAGTYILKPSLFEIPRLGSINLHSGRVPEYRGSAPGFWELYNGEAEVGITIHKVVKRLDAGPILLQELFPLNGVPTDQPLAYLEDYRQSVLRPNGVRMLTHAVDMIAKGTVTEQAQDRSRAKTYPYPNYKELRELKRRIRDRRGKHRNGKTGT